MFNRKWNRMLVVGGTVALVAIGATPAAASVPSCPFPTPTRFTSGTTYLGQEPGSNIWSTDVKLTAYCGDVAPSNELSGVAVVAVYATSTGTVPMLEASANGTTPTTMLPVPANPADFTAANLSTKDPITGKFPVTDANGSVTFKLRALSPTHPFLAGPDGAPQLIGLQLDWGSGTGTFVDPMGAKHDFPAPVFGGGGIYAATPELDSLALFGTGAASLGGYVLLRLRARRRN